MDTRKPANGGTKVMQEIRDMAQEGGVLGEGMLVTDCIVLLRCERVDGSAVRARFHPMGQMEDLRERGLIEQHRDDVCDEDRARR